MRVLFSDLVNRLRSMHLTPDEAMSEKSRKEFYDAEDGRRKIDAALTAAIKNDAKNTEQAAHDIYDLVDKFQFSVPRFYYSMEEVPLRSQ